MKQKIVIKVQMHCDKCRAKAMKIAAEADGVNSVAIGGKDKEEIVVKGEGIDSAALTCLLRKKLGFAAIISVGEEKEEKKPEEKKAVEICKALCSSAYCPCPQCTTLYRVVYEPNPPMCSIM